VANKKHLKILEGGYQHWNEWRRTTSETPNLTQHDFQRRYLNELDLSNALLMGSNFSNCHLNDASLISADVRGANFSGASVSGADFSHAIFADTTMNNVILINVKGLATTEHWAYSPIDVATITITANWLKGSPDRQQAREVELFFRASGIPNELLALFRTWSGQDIHYASCFISYSHADSAFAMALERMLSSRGVTCWLDRKSMLPGDHIHDAIAQGVRQSDKILVCCSASSLNSWWVGGELDRALEKEQLLSAATGVVVRVLIPLNLDGYLFDPAWQSGYSALVRSRLASDFVGWQNDFHAFDDQVERLLEALRIH
jgi:hypothetical protein